MTDKTSETKHKLCPIHVNRQLGETGYCMDCGGFPTKCSVGKAEDKSISIETGKNLSYVPKSEPCTHEPYWILWIEGENKLIHCSKCNGTWNIEKFAEEIRQQTRKETAREIINDINNWETIACGMWEVKQQIKKWIEKYGVDA